MGRSWKTGWEFPPVQPPPKTYNDGLEAAAAYLEGTSTSVDPAKIREFAAAIRALKALED